MDTYVAISCWAFSFVPFGSSVPFSPFWFTRQRSQFVGCCCCCFFYFPGGGRLFRVCFITGSRRCMLLRLANFLSPSTRHTFHVELGKVLYHTIDTQVTIDRATAGQPSLSLICILKPGSVRRSTAVVGRATIVDVLFTPP